MRNFALTIFLLPLVLFSALKTEKDLPQAAAAHMGQIYVMLHLIDRAASTERVNYWIGGATLLGAVRNNALIPWEASAHLEFFIDDRAQMQRALEQLRQHGFISTFDSSEQVFIVYRAGQFQPAVYLYGMKYQATSKRYESDQIHPWGPSYWTPNELMHKQRVKLGPVELNMPVGAYYHVQRRYGIGALSTAMVKIEGKYFKIPLTQKLPTPFKIPDEWKLIIKDQSDAV